MDTKTAVIHALEAFHRRKYKSSGKYLPKHLFNGVKEALVRLIKESEIDICVKENLLRNLITLMKYH